MYQVCSIDIQKYRQETILNSFISWQFSIELFTRKIRLIATSTNRTRILIINNSSFSVRVANNARMRAASSKAVVFNRTTNSWNNGFSFITAKCYICKTRAVRASSISSTLWKVSIAIVIPLSRVTTSSKAAVSLKEKVVKKKK